MKVLLNSFYKGSHCRVSSRNKKNEPPCTTWIVTHESITQERLIEWSHTKVSITGLNVRTTTRPRTCVINDWPSEQSLMPREELKYFAYDFVCIFGPDLAQNTFVRWTYQHKYFRLAIILAKGKCAKQNTVRGSGHGIFVSCFEVFLCINYSKR